LIGLKPPQKILKHWPHEQKKGKDAHANKPIKFILVYLSYYLYELHLLLLARTHFTGYTNDYIKNLNEMFRPRATKKAAKKPNL
jgi:hypothetical protein